MSRVPTSGSRPKLACEISADRVLAGRVSEAGGTVLEACASSELAPGSVVPDLIETNLRQPDAVYETVRDTLGSVGGRSRDVIAVLPDASVRVVLLDFDTLPVKRDEAESVVRLSRSISAANFLFPWVLRRACSRMLFSILATVRS